MALPIPAKQPQTASQKSACFSVNLEFEGIISSESRGLLIVDTAKFLLYQRFQLPLPFNQLQCLKNSEGKSGKKGILDLEARKRTTAVATLKSMFAQLEKAFSKNHQISEVAILLGGTVVSPKETFLVTFPSAVYDGRVLTVPEAKTRLMRQLVTHPCWAEIPELKPTKMHVFIHASRDDELSQLGLRPRTSFKKPTTGRVFRLNFMCQCSVVSSELSQLEESDFELSGVEPLEVSQAETPLRKDIMQDSRIRSFTKHVEANQTFEQPDDFIWYQIPVVAQGLKNKHSLAHSMQT